MTTLILDLQHPQPERLLQQTIQALKAGQDVTIHVAGTAYVSDGAGLVESYLVARLDCLIVTGSLPAGSLRRLRFTRE